MKYLRTIISASLISLLSTPLYALPLTKPFSTNSVMSERGGRQYEAGNFSGVSYFIFHSEKSGLFAGKKEMITDEVVNHALAEDAKTNLNKHWRVTCDENNGLKYCQISKRDMVVAIAEKMPPLVRIKSIPKLPTTIGMIVGSNKSVVHESDDGFFTIEQSEELIQQMTTSISAVTYYNDLVKHEDVTDPFDLFGFNAAFKFSIWMLSNK